MSFLQTNWKPPVDSRPYLFLSKIKISSILLVWVQGFSKFPNKLLKWYKRAPANHITWSITSKLLSGFLQAGLHAAWHSTLVLFTILQWYSVLPANHGFMPPFSTAALFSFIYWIFKSSCTVGVDLSWSCDYSFNYWHFYHSQSLRCLPSCWHEMESFQDCSLWALEPQPYTLCHINILKSIEMLMSWFP